MKDTAFILCATKVNKSFYFVLIELFESPLKTSYTTLSGIIVFNKIKKYINFIKLNWVIYFLNIFVSCLYHFVSIKLVVFGRLRLVVKDSPFFTALYSYIRYNQPTFISKRGNSDSHNYCL